LTPGEEDEASITLSDNIVKILDGLAGPGHRSAWIECAVRAYALVSRGV